jgi:glyceraldehyde 3-phosphate dehydrogenase
MVKLSVNGFGRIGRLVTRLIIEETMIAWSSSSSTDKMLQIVHINEMHGDANTSAYLLEFDSVHGRWSGFTCSAPDQTTIVVTHTASGNNCQIQFTNESDAAKIPWDGIDLVVECTGANKTREKLAPILNNASVKKIVVSAPMKEDVPNIVIGVNDHAYHSNEHKIVTAASCTTNAIAPVVKVLHENIGITHGMITTIHNTTNTQCTIDTAWPGKKEIRRTRSAGANLIPTTTGSAKAITQIFPELNGLLDGRAVRVSVFCSFLML